MFCRAQADRCDRFRPWQFLTGTSQAVPAARVARTVPPGRSAAAVSNGAGWAMMPAWPLEFFAVTSTWYSPSRRNPCKSMFWPTPFASAVSISGTKWLPIAPLVCSRPSVSTRNNPPPPILSVKLCALSSARSKNRGTPSCSVTRAVSGSGSGMLAAGAGRSQNSVTRRGWSAAGSCAVPVRAS